MRTQGFKLIRGGTQLSQGSAGGTRSANGPCSDHRGAAAKCSAVFSLLLRAGSSGKSRRTDLN